MRPKTTAPAATRLPVLLALLVLLVLAGCGAQAEDATGAGSSTGSSPSGESHVMSDGSTMGGSEMDMHSADPTADPSEEPSEDYGGMSRDYSAEDQDGDGVIDRTGVGGNPSETATMVCSDQIRQAVRRTFRLAADPVGRPGWDGTTYTCTYSVGGADLVASVRDDNADTATRGRGYFRILKRQLPGAKRLEGIIGLGFPSYQSPAGHVVFLKDHKTLHVDTSALPASALPKGFSREEVAYSIASAVMVCWSA